MSRVLLVCAVALALLACGTQSATAAGFVVDVEARSLTDIESFTLRTPEGTETTFGVGRLELDAGAFPATHLREHMATGQAVAVAYREENGQPVAFRLADAPWLNE